MAFDGDQRKQAFIDTARQQANDGAHYLWSTAGNTPGNKDGAWYRPLKAQLHDNVPDLTGLSLSPATIATKYGIHAPMLFAAYADTSDFGLLVCTGRAAAVNTPLALSDMDANLHKAFDLKWPDLTDDQLDELQRNSNRISDFRWPRANSSLRNNSLHHSTVWGESCVDVRHFDCIGLINYCLSEILNQHIQYGIGNFVARSIGTVVSVSSAAAGDIVTIGAQHIGIVSERNTVIEAKDAISGVVEGPFSAAGWTQCFRLPDRFWQQ